MAECPGCRHHDSLFARRSLRCRLGIHWHWGRDMRVGSDDPFLNKCVECEYEWAYKGSYLNIWARRWPWWLRSPGYRFHFWWKYRVGQAAWRERQDG